LARMGVTARSWRMTEGSVYAHHDPSVLILEKLRLERCARANTAVRPYTNTVWERE
jgi:hypothetical protein